MDAEACGLPGYFASTVGLDEKDDQKIPTVPRKRRLGTSEACNRLGESTDVSPWRVQ